MVENVRVCLIYLLGKRKHITGKSIDAFHAHLTKEGYAESTKEKYVRDVRLFKAQLGDKPLTKEALSQIKEELKATYKDTSLNSMIASLNTYLEFRGLSHLKQKSLKVKKTLFMDASTELTKEEFNILCKIAKKTNYKLYLLLITLASTGIRISEIKYITLDATKDGQVIVDNKGKKRVVFLPQDLVKKLRAYAQKEKREDGLIFVTSKGNTPDRSNIYRAMKRLALRAGIDQKKVYPHNLRHLFATVHYETHKDLSHLADVLGHSSVETTRIYIATSGKTHKAEVEALKLIA